MTTLEKVVFLILLGGEMACFGLAIVDLLLHGLHGKGLIN